MFSFRAQKVLDDPEVRRVWGKYCLSQQNVSGDAKGQCLVTGAIDVPIAVTHPNIKGVKDTQSSGASLVSFNAPSLESFGNQKGQGRNAPVSKIAAFAYTTALNDLLADREHVLQMGDTTIVYWAETGQREEQDIFAALMGGDPEPALQDAIQKLIRGLPAEMESGTISPEDTFYVLGLSPNAARISVRFFLINTLGAFAKDIGAHQQRMSIVRPSYLSERYTSLQDILRETSRKTDKTPMPPPYLAGALMRAVLTNSAYPEALYRNILLRIHADHDINFIRAGFIKAYLVKNHAHPWEGEIQMAVNDNCREPAYILGRLFAVLESIQQAANPGISATIKDRYFNAACATPASIFPILLKLSNAHLKKLESGQRVFFSKKTGALIGKIAMPDAGAPIPPRLSLEEQGAFIVGYYQEMQARFTKKEEQ